MRHPRLPLLYFALAHASLAMAFFALAAVPERLIGFFYHPRLLAVVHLITLGWISAAILGALYMIAPMALRASLPVRRADVAAFASFAVGLVGMAGHFWLDSPPGMVWSAGLAAAALLYVSGRAARAVWRAPIPREVRLCFVFAFANVTAAAGLGVLIGVDKVVPVLGGYVLTNVYAHAHMAALGWAVMTVMGAGYRLLPMLLPAAAPRGWPVLAGALLLEAGTLGLFVAFLARSRAAGPFAVVAAAGIAVFLSQVAWMRRNPRPAPKDARKPDYGVLHVGQAMAYLGVTVALGLALALAPPAVWKLQAALLYGTIGLVGFLARMVAGVADRLLPLYAWLRSYARLDLAERPPSVYHLLPRRLQAATFWLWTAGVPLLAAGLALGSAVLVRAGAGILLAAVLAGGAGHAAVYRRTAAPLAGQGGPPPGGEARPPARLASTGPPGSKLAARELEGAESLARETSRGKE